jgi:hypothetical protein
MNGWYEYDYKQACRNLGVPENRINENVDKDDTKEKSTSFYSRNCDVEYIDVKINSKRKQRNLLMKRK